MKIRMTTELGPFEGEPTAGNLCAALASLPRGAFVDVTQWSSQHEGTGWRVKASWAEER